MKDLARHLSRSDISEATVRAIPLREARAAMIPFRVAQGFLPRSVKLLTAPNENLKLTHSETDRVAGFGLSIAPADMSMVGAYVDFGTWLSELGRHCTLSGAELLALWEDVQNGWNTCRYASKGCRSACLATSGKGAFTSTQRGRVWKTAFLGAMPAHFLRVLVAEIEAIKVGKWEAAGWTVSFRFNVLSDLPWEMLAPWILELLAARGIRAYDYTAYPSARRPRAVADSLNYYVVDSVKESHTNAQIRAMARPVVVFDTSRGHALPTMYLGRPVIDADVSDARFLDMPGTVRGLRFKNVTTTDRAAAVASGFVKVA